MRYVIDARNAVSYTRPECGIVRDGYDCDPDGHRLGINETCLTFDGCPSPGSATIAVWIRIRGTTRLP